jgi:hypothetical protein
MKSALLLIATAGATLHAIALESAIPTDFPAERYEQMIAKSPFALATPPAPVAAPPEKNFADGWYVSGLAQLDGKDFVTIKSRDLSVQLSLFGNEPRDGVTLQKVEWSKSIGRSTVTIAKDGQTAKREFNQAELSSGAAPAAAPPPGAVRSAVPTPSAANRPVIPRPLQPVVQPQARTGLPNTTVLPKPNPVIGGGITAPTPDTRRRIRVINNVPAQQ